MLGIAFSIGFASSFHCLGMCGPLAFGVASIASPSRTALVTRALVYNSGRVLSYIALGLVIGLFSDLISLAGYQQYLSILVGISLITLSLLSMDLERFLHRSSLFRNANHVIQRRLSKILNTGAQKYPLALGMVNGLLPCGMVYLALTAAITSGSTLSSAAVMACFGLGTFPMMLGIMLIPMQGRSMAFAKRLATHFIPIIQIILGLYLIYRGLSIIAPDTLDFWLAIKNPLMCH